MSKKLLFIISATLLTLLLISNEIIAGDEGGGQLPYGKDGRLYFEAGWDTVFVAGTTESNDTIATIPLRLTFDSTNTSDMQRIRFVFHYGGSLELIDAYMDSSNWDGDFSIEGSGSDSIITLDFGSVATPVEMTTYAYLKFKLDCTEESSVDTILLYDDLTGCEVVYVGGGSAFAESGNCEYGAVVNEEYKAGFDIDDVIAIGGIGKIDSVAVTAESNFYIARLQHDITYNHNLIEFIDFWPEDSTVWNNIIYTTITDTISIFLQSCDSCCGTQYTDIDTIYWLKYKIKCTQSINGNKADITFDTLNCDVAPRSGYSVICSYLRKPYELADGEISVPQYDNTYKMDFSCDGCDDEISKCDSMAYVMIQMDNNFPAGGTNNAIVVNFDMGDNFRDPDLVELQNSPVDYDMNKQQSSTYYASAYQVFDSSKDNYHPVTDNANDMFMLELEADLSTISPANFDDKYVSFDFCVEYGSNPPCTSLTWDTTSTIAVKYEDSSLHFDKAYIQVLMGEFSVDKVTGGTCAATQSLYVRNTFALDTFSIRIYSPTVEVEIDAIDTSIVSGVGYTKINDRTYDVFSTGVFSSISANGDNYTKVAEIDYIIDGACMPENNWIYIVPELSNKLMKDTDGGEHYVVLESDSVGLYCHYCGSGAPPTKLADQSSLLPTEFNMYPCRPNPFNPETQISFDLPEACNVSIEIFNILGRKVTTLVDKTMEPGRHTVTWNSADNGGQTVSSGIYLCIMRAGEFTATQKMSLLK